MMNKIIFKDKKGKQKSNLFGPFFQGKKGMKNFGKFLAPFSGKKGVGVSQVFIFIMAAVTFAVIMLFGVKSIQNFLSDANQVEFVQFKLDLESSVDEIRTDYGAVSVENFRTPVGYTQICFVDLDYGADAGDQKDDKLEELRELDPIAYTIWAEIDPFDPDDLTTGYQPGEPNVFLSPPSEIRMGVSRIDIEEGYFCEPIKKGRFTLILEGKGDRTALFSAEEAAQESAGTTGAGSGAGSGSGTGQDTTLPNPVVPAP